MPKVSAKVGLTLKLFQNSQYEFIRPEIGIEGIDTDGDIDYQISESVKALRKVWETVSDEMNNQLITQMPNVNKEMELQVATKLKTMQKAIDTLSEEIHKKK